MLKNTWVATLVMSVIPIALSGTACSRAEPMPSAMSGSRESTAMAPAAGHEGMGKVVKVVVDGSGFNPSTLAIKKGEHVMLEFTRLTDKTCATSVALPELNITKDLPLNQPVQIPIPTHDARTLTFSCGMGMIKGTLVIS
ncbi:MAG: cupredoxin domain-containing protein [Polyangiaceae bacterium]|jgi:plastocyanin domain-containing protein